MEADDRTADETEAEPVWTRRREGARRVLVIACGALAREILEIGRAHV